MIAPVSLGGASRWGFHPDHLKAPAGLFKPSSPPWRGWWKANGDGDGDILFSWIPDAVSASASSSSQDRIDLLEKRIARLESLLAKMGVHDEE